MWIREESTGTVSGSDERRVAWRAHVSIYKSVVECTIIQCSKFTSELCGVPLKILHIVSTTHFWSSETTIDSLPMS